MKITHLLKGILKTLPRGKVTRVDVYLYNIHIIGYLEEEEKKRGSWTPAIHMKKFYFKEQNLTNGFEDVLALSCSGLSLSFNTCQTEVNLYVTCAEKSELSLSLFFWTYPQSNQSPKKKKGWRMVCCDHIDEWRLSRYGRLWASNAAIRN